MSCDWPLSREEKKSLVLQLYDQDVEAADRLLRNYTQQLQSLTRNIVDEPHTKNKDAGQFDRLKSRRRSCGDCDCDVSETKADSVDAVTSFRLAMATAAAALGFAGLMGVSSEEEDIPAGEVPKQRARSEGARACLMVGPKQRRVSRNGKPLRVSFADSDKRPGDSDSDCVDPAPEPEPGPDLEPIRHVTKRRPRQDALQSVSRSADTEIKFRNAEASAQTHVEKIANDLPCRNRREARRARLQGMHGYPEF